jgi:MYXO-CTERM domain-containing protein
MKKVTLIAAAGVAGMMAVPALGATLWDNGGPDGVNGYSNATSGIFGFRRTLLDDFDLASPSSLTGLNWKSVWGTPMGGAMGIGAEISIRSDIAGTPGATIAVANLNGYSEAATGGILFSREEVESMASFDAIALGAGRYWFEATIVGPENNFWLTAPQQLSECWVNYEDLGGFQSGTDQFGAPSDINFQLQGVPAPGALALLGLAGLAGSRRRRA